MVATGAVRAQPDDITASVAASAPRPVLAGHAKVAAARLAATLAVAVLAQLGGPYSSVAAFGPSTVQPEAACSVVGGQDRYGDDWYHCSRCNGVTGIEFPSGSKSSPFTAVAANAFRNCTELKTADLATNPHLTSVGDRAFQGCTSLTTITLPAGLTSVGYVAFAGCTSLAAITLPAGLNWVGDYAFHGCTSLAAITLPAGVTSVSNDAFEGCTSLAAVTLPGVTIVGDFAFFGCTSLAAITLPAGLTSVGLDAFAGCTELATVHIPSAAVDVGYHAFYKTKCCPDADCNVRSNVIYNICDCKQC